MDVDFLKARRIRDDWEKTVGKQAASTRKADIAKPRLKTPLADARKRQAEEKAAEENTAAQVARHLEAKSMGWKEQRPAPLAVIQPKHIKEHGVGKSHDWNRAYKEHYNKHTLRSASAQGLKDLTLEDIFQLDYEYAENRKAGYIPWTHEAHYGYPGLTRWFWPGPIVLELIEWDGEGSRKYSQEAARQLILEKAEKAGKSLTAAKASGITKEQVKIADMVLRYAEKQLHGPGPRAILLTCTIRICWLRG
jgi:hypothetical protein